MNTLKRIIVATNTSPASVNALFAAADLAARMQAQIETLFIEDIALLQLAEMPFSLEIDRLSGVRRNLNLTELTQDLHRMAARIDRMVQSLCAERKIHGQFRVVRGNYLAEAMQSQPDVLFMIPPGQPLIAASLNSPLHTGKPPATKITAPVCAYIPQCEGSDRAGVLAAELAGILGVELLILLPPEQAATADEDRSRIETTVPASRPKFLVIEDDFSQFVKRLAKKGCSLFVAPRCGLDTGRINQLREVACPLVLVA